MILQEPGTGSAVVEGLFYFLIVLFFGVVTVLIARTAFLMSLLWVMPLARVFSFVPPIRRWIERKTTDPAPHEGRSGMQ